MRPRKISAYVKARRKLAGLEAKLVEREQQLLPLKRKVTAARIDVQERRRALTGGEIGAAERLLNVYTVRLP
jgi:hypothetical protein